VEKHPDQGLGSTMALQAPVAYYVRLIVRGQFSPL